MPVIDNELLHRIKNAISVQSEVRMIVSEQEDAGIGLPIRDFIMLMQMLTPQSYGSKIQNRLIKQLGLHAVSSKNDIGDCEDNFGDRWEIKSSIINTSNNYLNLVQLRLWQEIRGYIIVVFDTRIDPMEIQVYRLDKNQMRKECELCNASAAHGTQRANANNENVELRFSVKIENDDPIFKRWQQYRSRYEFSN